MGDEVGWGGAIPPSAGHLNDRWAELWPQMSMEPKGKAPKKGPKKGAQRKGTIFIDGPSMIIIDGP